jgi:hypothetical protein
LSLCKQIALHLGGDLVFNEEIKEGCEFSLHLNLKKIEVGKSRLKRGKMKFGKREPSSAKSVTSSPSELGDIIEIPDLENNASHDI